MWDNVISSCITNEMFLEVSALNKIMRCKLKPPHDHQTPIFHAEDFVLFYRVLTFCITWRFYTERSATKRRVKPVSVNALVSATQLMFCKMIESLTALIFFMFLTLSLFIFYGKLLKFFFVFDDFVAFDFHRAGLLKDKNCEQIGSHTRWDTKDYPAVDS